MLSAIHQYLSFHKLVIQICISLLNFECETRESVWIRDRNREREREKGRTNRKKHSLFIWFFLFFFFFLLAMSASWRTKSYRIDEYCMTWISILKIMFPNRMRTPQRNVSQQSTIEKEAHQHIRYMSLYEPFQRRCTNQHRRLLFGRLLNVSKNLFPSSLFQLFIYLYSILNFVFASTLFPFNWKSFLANV